MGRTQTFEEFLTATSPEIPIWSFLVNLVLAGLLCYLLSLIYIRFGRSLSNRASLARNFIILGVTTMLVISIVKSSLALSLGLVGALSIVRFRTAIKEPEELTYVFVTIAVGLGLGAGQRLTTVLAFAAIVAIVCAEGLLRRKANVSNLYLIVASRGPRKISLEHATDILTQNSTALSLKRFDESADAMEASYLVRFSDYQQLERAKTVLQSQGDSVTVSFVDNDGVT